MRSFQNFNGLSVDGVVGPNTWRELLVLNPGSKVLKQGSVGSYVLYLQQKLQAKLFPVGVLDGVFGANTATAVRTFQEENGLSVDGIVGPNTWNALLPIGGGRPFPYN